MEFTGLLVSPMRAAVGAIPGEDVTQQCDIGLMLDRRKPQAA